MNDVVYDLEILRNVFICCVKEIGTDRRWVFEISDRRNDAKELMDFLTFLRLNNVSMIGYNNISFDYPILHYFINNWQYITVEMLWQKCRQIINTEWNDRFAHIIWESDHYVPQIDLLKIHHFDNVAKTTSLKVLEFNMRMDTIEDFPFDPNSELNWEQIDSLIKYCFHDLAATELFAGHSESQIAFRRNLSEKFGRNVMNHSDAKIGKDFLINEMERHSPGICFDRSSGRKEKRQTFRSKIHFKDILLPYISFVHPEFQRVHRWFQENHIINTKGGMDMHCTVRDFTFDFGTGGIHGAVDPCVVTSDDHYMILDIDVTSYYPSLAIANKFYPEHLGEIFCVTYADLKQQRLTYVKKTAENLMLKLALNASFGDTNSVYSALYDPQYTMAITVNGQLLLCMLAETLMRHVDVKIFHANTDGLALKIPRTLYPWVKEVMGWWEKLTGLDLEEEEYNRFFIRDTNNYVAEKVDKSTKRKGAYEYKIGPGKLEWHKNHSALVVRKAAEAKLLHGTDIRTFVENHGDIHDFLLRTKINRTDKLLAVGYDGIETEQQRVSRYYISMIGSDLIKVMPPTPAQVKGFANPGTDVFIKRGGKDEGKFYFADTPEKKAKVNKKWEQVNKAVITSPPDRRIGINVGWKVNIANNISHVFPDDIEYEYYITEAKKLTDPILNGGVM